MSMERKALLGAALSLGVTVALIATVLDSCPADPLDGGGEVINPEFQNARVNQRQIERAKFLKKLKTKV